MRLTKDLNTPHDDTTYSDIVEGAIDRENICLTKLKHYEDIEDELGIDLITLFKVLKNGIYRIFYKGGEPNKIGNLDINFDKKALSSHWQFLDMSGYDSGTNYYYFKDYGKTWSLDKNDLIKE